MEEVAHGIDEDHLRFGQFQWLDELLGHQPEVETPRVRVTGCIAKPFGKGFCIAVFATRADFVAAPHKDPNLNQPIQSVF